MSFISRPVKDVPGLRCPFCFSFFLDLLIFSCFDQQVCLFFGFFFLLRFAFIYTVFLSTLRFHSELYFQELQSHDLCSTIIFCLSFSSLLRNVQISHCYFLCSLLPSYLGVLARYNEYLRPIILIVILIRTNFQQ